MYKEKVQIQGLKRDFEVERVGSKMEKTTNRSDEFKALGHGGLGERNRESNGEDGGSSERECVGVKDRVRVFFFNFFFIYTGRVWIISIPYPNYSGNIHTLPN